MSNENTSPSQNDKANIQETPSLAIKEDQSQPPDKNCQPSKEKSKTEQVKKKSRKKWWNNNWDKVLTICINAILAWFTYALFEVASSQTTAANQAVSEARIANKLTEEALKLQESKDNRDRITKIIDDSLERIDNEKRNFNDSMNLDFTKKSITAQIQNLRESRERFTAETRPYLGIIDMSIDTTKGNGIFDITFKHINYGKLPAKILRNKFWVYYSTSADIENVMKRFKINEFKDINHNAIISGDFVLKSGIYDVQIDKQLYNPFLEGKVFIFVFGEITYQNNYSGSVYFKNILYRLSFRNHGRDITVLTIKDNE